MTNLTSVFVDCYAIVAYLRLEMIKSMSRHSKGLKKPLDSVVTKTYPHYIDPTSMSCYYPSVSSCHFWFYLLFLISLFVFSAQALRREQLAKQKDSDYMDEFEDDEVIDSVAAKKSNKLTAELELLSSASGQVGS